MDIAILPCHIIAFFAGFILDLIIGDPRKLPHPVQFIGKLISSLENKLYIARRPDETGGQNGGKRSQDRRQFIRGALLAILVIIAALFISAGILAVAYIVHPVLFIIIETIMTWQILAIKSLRTESMKVYKMLTRGTIEEARRAVSMIVGRDTDSLDAASVTRAAVETVAENASDGVIAPMIYTAIGGPVLGFVYKAVNTMDSMIGYKNDRYLYFGRAAARTDDVFNFIPARISAYLMITAACILGKDFDGKRAARIYKRDRKKHKSPNAGQTESVCAGALGVRLLGDASYFGKIVKKPYIGDDVRPVEPEDIRRANMLMYAAAFLCEGICLAVMFGIFIATGR